MHKVEIELMDTLVYRAKCIVNNASRHPIRIVSNAAASAPPLMICIGQYVTGGRVTGGRHSDHSFWVRGSK
jgi:hypothetical protein